MKDNLQQYIDFFEAMQAIKNGHTVRNQMEPHLTYFYSLETCKIMTKIYSSKKLAETLYMPVNVEWWIVE